ncbi:MAG: acetate--CoA ligase family protein [Polyangiales bacterium]
MAVRIICESPELALECLQAADAVGLAVEPIVAEAWLSAAIEQAAAAIALASSPSLPQLVVLGDAAQSAGRPIALASLAPGSDGRRVRDAALDLGITAVAEIGPLLSVLCLHAAGAQQPWTASLRALGKPARARLETVQAAGSRKGGHFLPAEGGAIAWSDDAEEPGRVVGKARDLAEAVAALRDTDRGSPKVESVVEVDAPAVSEVLFGPRRALSDPASKAALVPYGIPFPTEELCSSASRAAAEANRIGFPVRISLTSPDLRIWDHPDLAVDMVDNAARVRDTFRQLIGMGRARLESRGASARAADRLLGAMVTETSEAAALLGVRAWGLPHGRVALEIGFADPHGAAADDRTWTVLPAPIDALERALRRLQGANLLFGGTSASRKLRLDAIRDVLLRVAAFVRDRRDEIESVELRPLALLLDGTAEVREACVNVSDAFERSLSLPPGQKTGS